MEQKTAFLLAKYAVCVNKRCEVALTNDWHDTCYMIMRYEILIVLFHKLIFNRSRKVFQMAEKVLSQDQKFSELSNTPKVDQKKDHNSMNTLKVDLTQWLSINENQIVDFHNRIADLWRANKDRNLATVESAIRGIGTDIERLSLALPKLGSDKVSDSSNGSKFSKPR